MTTPPTPAGWYPDPDGSGGQRYWDGNLWTEHRYPAAPPPSPEPVEPQQVAPGEPASPPASEEPTAVVQLPPEPVDEPTAVVQLPPESIEQRVGSHRRPDPEPEPEPAPEPAFESTPIFESTTESFRYEPDPVSQGFTPEPAATPAPTFGAPSTPPPSQSEPFGSAPAFEPAAAPPSRDRGILLPYLAVCAVLLAVLVGLSVYGFVIKKDPGVQIASGTETTTETSSPTSTESTATTSETPTESPTAGPTTVGPTGDVTDGPLSFTVHGIEVGSTVVMSDAPLEKEAVGEFVVIHMTVTNVGTDPASFIGMFQTLHAGGTTYPLDDEATAYLEGTFADLEPGQSADVSVAYDVPVGTPPESIELHADPSTPGAEVPLA